MWYPSSHFQVIKKFQLTYIKYHCRNSRLLKQKSRISSSACKITKINEKQAIQWSVNVRITAHLCILSAKSCSSLEWKARSWTRASYNLVTSMLSFAYCHLLEPALVHTDIFSIMRSALKRQPEKSFGKYQALRHITTSAIGKSLQWMY